MRRLLFPLFCLLFAAPALAQEPEKDCSVTSTGLVPAVYERSAAHELAGLIAAARVVPRLADGTPDPAGKKVTLIRGMSSLKNFQARLAMAIRGALKVNGVVPPEIVVIEGAQDRQATAEWGTTVPWDRVDTLLAANGVTRNQVQVIVSMEAVRYTELYGAMRPEQVTRTIEIAKERYPHLALNYSMGLGYTGYHVPPPGTQPHAFINGDGYLLRSLAETQTGVPDGVWFDYISIEADGVVPNPATASPSYPAGLAYSCDMYKDDGYHYTGEGTRMLPINLGERLPTDPVWRVAMGLQAPPELEPPPPPVTVPLSGELTKDGACTFSAIVGGVPRTVTLPAIWCDGL